MSQDNFGAGVFDDTKPVTPARPESQEAPAAAPAVPGPGPSFEGETTENPPGSSEFMVQQERDREKAMLLRRTRGEGSPDTQEPERRPNGGNRWEQRGQGERPGQRGGGGRPTFGGGHGDNMRRGGNMGDRPMERAPERAPERSIERPSAVETPEREMQTPPPIFGNRAGNDRRAMPDRRHQGEGIANTGTVLLDQRVAVLVDVQNMYHSARKLHGRNLSYSKLVQNTVKGRKLVRAIAYLLDRDGVDQGGFLEHLSHSGFEVRRKELIERADGSRKGDWDLGIAIDAITLADKVDVVMLVSGDGDFACLAQLLRHRGVKVEIASFRESTADALVQAADGFHPLGKDSLY